MQTNTENTPNTNSYFNYKNLSPQQLLKKFHQMGVLLLLDAPEGLQFGIDNISWEVGNKFKGIKLIPLGTHIITYSLKDENYMFPIKKFIYFGTNNNNPSSNQPLRDDQRIKVYRWSRKIQRFLALTGQQAQGYRQGVKKYHFDCYLGPYPEQNVQFWLTNTKFITKQVLDKLDPVQYYEDYEEQYEGISKKKIMEIQEQLENVNIDSESEGDGDGVEQEQEAEQQAGGQQDIDNCQQIDPQIIQQDNPQQKQKNKNRTKQKITTTTNTTDIKKNKDFGGNIYYSQIPRRLTQSTNHTTHINIDRTEVLESIIKSQWTKKIINNSVSNNNNNNNCNSSATHNTFPAIVNQYGVLGELQYSFISFLIGQCQDSYTQWKKLTIMLSACQTAFNTHKNLMLEFIVVFYEQIKQFPQNFFYDELAKDNFLTICLKNFQVYFKQRSINKKALSRIQKLLVFVKEKFNFQLEEEQEQEPVVVGENQSYF